MPACSAVNCTSRSEKTSGKTFHLFPRCQPKLYQQWVVNLKRDKWKPSPGSRLCSDHFDDSCFDRTGARTRLRSSAVPTLFNFPEHHAEVGANGRDLETLFPAASATSRALGSGLSLTELVGEHYRQQQQLHLAFRERDALRQQLDELSREVADRVPLVARHMEEYEKALQSVGSLREQLTTALVEQERLIQERDEARRVLAHAERQSQRWQMQCQDLSKARGRQKSDTLRLTDMQVKIVRAVCQLLKEVEDARSGYAMRAQEQEISLSEEGTPLSEEEVISKHLVSFRWAPSTDTGRRVDVTPPWP
ncbi:hypothetical protein HPB47_018643 [Ixodes persulcatus]|uniref:Uncharacterized protein n=1 Tax=Ixodes persulcatus TaxID=34615 RepID=A0AC60QK81_IXOPE|nr:hypothetical protein HPB47_018643 [Ixodes persulcatus]